MSCHNIIEAIDAWGEREPQRIAYRTTQKKWTYGELKTYSDILANYLTRTVDKQGPVLIYGGLEFEMVVGFLASVKSGHAYIPIEAHTPVERITQIMETAAPVCILAVAPWPVELKTDIPVLTQANLTMCVSASDSITKQKSLPAMDDAYYIIFTSGTTGVPKGVQISHNNLISFVRWMLESFHLQEGLRFLAQAPYSFDLSVMSLYPALVSGGSLVPLEKAVIADFKSLFAQLPKLELDVWVSTPSFMDICLMEQTFDESHVPSLKTCLFCGEELTRSTAEKLLQRFPSADIYNTYGPTEATVAVSSVQVTKQLLDEYERLPIGRVKEDTTALILQDEHEVSPGQTGEIVLVGPSISKGYLNNEEKTAAAFFHWQQQPAYRTGDAGKILHDGMLVYEGRIDFQIKLHGYRIELGDIEYHLESLQLVKQAVVVPKYTEHKVHYLVAYIIAADHAHTTDFQLTKALKEELGQSVMDYMIPQRFQYVKAFPRTANGKLDRKALMTEVNG